MDEKSALNRGAYHHGNLRAALIEAGLAALATGHAQELSLRLLARQVGVTANAAYRHFADKEDLLNALAAEGFRRFADQQVQAVAPHVGATERLRASGMAYIAFATSHAPLFKLMFSRVSSPSIHTHQELQQASLSAMSVLLGEAADQIQVPAGDERALVMAAACWSLVHGLSELAQGGQLAVFGIEPHDLIERVMCLPGLLKA